MVIFVFGYPGSGKSYFAQKLAEELNFSYCNSDRIRKQIFSVKDYSPDKKMLVYLAMLSELEDAIAENKGIVLDATFYQKETRNMFKNKVSEAKVNSIWIEIKAQEETIRQRVSAAREDSDADFIIYQKIKEEFEPFDLPHLTLYSDEMSLSEMVNQAKNYYKNHG